MALDHALVRRAARTHEGVIRVYAWSRPTLSFGRNEAVRGRYSGYDAVRRPTGGRTILHDRELTYSFTLPGDERPRMLYARLTALLAAAVERLGAPVEIVDQRHGVTRHHGACFAVPAPGELVYGGRKIAGSAQWWENGAVLQHGSILIDDDQSAIGGTEVATLRGVLGRAPTLDELAEAFRCVVDAEPLDVEQTVRDEATELRRHYEDVSWTWRR